MRPVEFEFLLKLVKSRSGLVLAAGNPHQLESRLHPLLRRTGIGSFGALVARLRQPSAEPLIAQVVEALAARETWFFRDQAPFDDFAGRIVPALLASRSEEHRIRIWCAAASTGQEPYSLAMSIKEMGDRLSGWQIEILATDISNEALRRARSAIYSQFEVQRGLPIMLLLKYFKQIDENWQIGPDIRAMVQFRMLNLIGDFAKLGIFDVVFCRNVLIYFDQPTKISVLDRLAQNLDRDGYLVLGAAETVVGLTESLKPVPDCRGLYAHSAALKAPVLRIVADNPAA